IARLLRPVMKIMSVIPAAAASSTAYWISGLSTTGSISLGLALVTGRKRVPRPATGNTALVTLAIAIEILVAHWKARTEFPLALIGSLERPNGCSQSQCRHLIRPLVT